MGNGSYNGITFHIMEVSPIKNKKTFNLIMTRMIESQQEIREAFGRSCS